MHTNAQTFSDNHTTARTCLARVVGIHGDDLRTSILDFVRKHLPEQPQRRVMCGQRETTVVGHEREVQIFNCNQAVGFGKRGRALVPEVAPLVGDMLLQLGNLKPRPCASLCRTACA